MSYLTGRLEDTIMVRGDSNMEFPAHCELPATREVSDQEEVPSPTMRRFKLAMNRFARMPAKK